MRFGRMVVQGKQCNKNKALSSQGKGSNILIWSLQWSTNVNKSYSSVLDVKIKICKRKQKHEFELHVIILICEIYEIIHFEWSVFTNTVMTKGHLLSRGVYWMITCNEYLWIDGNTFWNFHTKTHVILKSKTYNTAVIIVTNAVLTEYRPWKKSCVNKINYLEL